MKQAHVRRMQRCHETRQQNIAFRRDLKHAVAQLTARGKTAVQYKPSRSSPQQTVRAVSTTKNEQAPVRFAGQGQTLGRRKENEGVHPQSNSQNTTFEDDSRITGGSARVLNGELRGRLEEEKVAIWHKEKNRLGKRNIDQPERERLLHCLAEICTGMMRDNRGSAGEVARSPGGSLMSAPVDSGKIRR